jgi:hypothetical protein
VRNTEEPRQKPGCNKDADLDILADIADDECEMIFRKALGRGVYKTEQEMCGIFTSVWERKLLEYANQGKPVPAKQPEGTATSLKEPAHPEDYRYSWSWFQALEHQLLDYLVPRPGAIQRQIDLPAPAAAAKWRGGRRRRDPFIGFRWGPGQSQGTGTGSDFRDAVGVGKVLPPVPQWWRWWEDIGNGLLQGQLPPEEVLELRWWEGIGSGFSPGVKSDKGNEVKVVKIERSQCQHSDFQATGTRRNWWTFEVC